jgi:membrane protease YdiL (CAAX protease family)
VPFTALVIASVLVYVWAVEGHAAPDWVFVPGAIVVSATAWNAYRRREWGFAWNCVGGGFLRSLAITSAGSAAVLAVGAVIGTLHDRRDFLGSLAPLVVWGGAQQWVLQTLVLREVQRATSRPAGIVIAAVLFAVVHLPNPVLTVATGMGALAWCWLYDRCPNIIPLALSHGLGTLALRYAFDDALIGRLRIGASYLRLGP